MCQERNATEVIIDGKSISVDTCLVDMINQINAPTGTLRTLGCCCGHGIYPKTIIVQNKYQKNGKRWDFCSGVLMPRKRGFYKLDDDGFYYIPESIK